MRLHLLRAGKVWVAMLCVFITMNAEAQVKKFGDIIAGDFTAYNQEYDSTMSAVILFDRGYVEFDSEYNCAMVFHRRIKILNDEGFEYGDIQIPIDEEENQAVQSIKGNTYTLTESGEIFTTSLHKDEIFETKVTDDYSLTKFTMPGLKPGVIIEYTYRKRFGPPYMLPDWKFHNYVPVQWSEYEMELPLALNYRLIFKGADSLYQNTVERSKFSGGDAQLIYLAKKDLPAIEDLPYLINRDDHVSEVITQLIGIRIPGVLPRDFFETWDDIAKELNNRDDFGRQRLNGDLKDKVAELVSEDMPDLAKIETLYNFVSQDISWDGYHRVVTEQGIRDTYKNKTGNTADINLLLVEMLREAGIKASPGLISIRSNGSVILDYPLINQFNSTLAVVEVNQSAFILDASLGERSFLFSHPKNLLRKALVIRDDNSYGWLTTLPIDKSSDRLSASYSLDDSSRISVKMEGRIGGAFSESMRQDETGCE